MRDGNVAPQKLKGMGWRPQKLLNCYYVLIPMYRQQSKLASRVWNWVNRILMVHLAHIAHFGSPLSSGGEGVEMINLVLEC